MGSCSGRPARFDHHSSSLKTPCHRRRRHRSRDAEDTHKLTPAAPDSKLTLSPTFTLRDLEGSPAPRPEGRVWKWRPQRGVTADVSRKRPGCGGSSCKPSQCGYTSMGYTDEETGYMSHMDRGYNSTFTEDDNDSGIKSPLSDMIRQAVGPGDESNADSMCVYSNNNNNEDKTNNENNNNEEMVNNENNSNEEKIQRAEGECHDHGVDGLFLMRASRVRSTPSASSMSSAGIVYEEFASGLNVSETMEFSKHCDNQVNIMGCYG